MSVKDKVSETEKEMKKKIASIYDGLYNTVGSYAEPKTKDIPLDRLALLYSKFSDKKYQLQETSRDIVLKYNLIENIKENKIKDGANPGSFDKESFISYLSGEHLKKIFFDSGLIEKKDKVEFFADLYKILEGNKEGIDKKTLAFYFKKFFAMINEPKEYFESKDNIENKYSELAEKTAEEMIELLGNGENIISINDFTNMMTSNEDYVSIDPGEIFP